MYKNLNAFGLGISARQSELIELALSNGYRGIDIDLDRFVRQVQRADLDSARRYLDSAVKFVETTTSGSWEFKVGGWDLPIQFAADPATYKEDLAKLPQMAEIAGAIGATRCRAIVDPAHDALAYHENFEEHRERLTEIAEILGKHDVRLGLDFQPAPTLRQGKAHEFVHKSEELLALVEAVSGNNVGIVLDTWNWYVGGGALDQIQAVGAAKLVQVRVADVPADADMANIGPQARALPSDDGLIDVKSLAAWLQESGYDGPVTPDPHVGQFTGKTREKIVAAGAESLEGMWIAAGLSEPKPEPELPPAETNGEAPSAEGEAAAEAEKQEEAAAT